MYLVTMRETREWGRLPERDVSEWGSERGSERGREQDEDARKTGERGRDLAQGPAKLTRLESDAEPEGLSEPGRARLTEWLVYYFVVLVTYDSFL